MRAFLTGLLVASLVAAPAAQAASITLACSGNVTAPANPKRQPSSLSIIVDLDKSTVVSEKIWDRPIPFIAIDANEVKFRADINCRKLFREPLRNNRSNNRQDRHRNG